MRALKKKQNHSQVNSHKILIKEVRIHSPIRVLLHSQSTINLLEVVSIIVSGSNKKLRTKEPVNVFSPTQVHVLRSQSRFQLHDFVPRLFEIL